MYLFLRMPHAAGCQPQTVGTTGHKSVSPASTQFRIFGNKQGLLLQHGMLCCLGHKPISCFASAQALLYNQPIVEEQEDGSVVVLVHALIALPNLVRPEEGRLLTAQPAAPEYWLKLKRPQAVAEVG